MLAMTGVCCGVGDIGYKTTIRAVGASSVLICSLVVEPTVYDAENSHSLALPY